MNDVSKLEGMLLDAAVAKAEGVNAITFVGCEVDGRPMDDSTTALPYSSDWAYGGPIIERERIAVAPGKPGEWMAFKQEPGADGGRHWPGPTPLIAAMRAFVASKQTG